MSPSFLPDTAEPDLYLLKEIIKGKTNDLTNVDEIVDDGQPSSPHKQTPPSGRPQSEPENVQDNLNQPLLFGEWSNHLLFDTKYGDVDCWLCWSNHILFFTG